jgi:NAD(P)-dependent dehydrogenase (short-subunit alcohol dehydrogenase family)
VCEPVPQTALILGARHLGRAIGEHLAARGWGVAAVARSQETVDAFEQAIDGSLGMALDASDPAKLTEAVTKTRERFGSLDLVVNAVTPGPSPSRGPFGGGPLIEATPEHLEHYALSVTRQAFAFLSVGARALQQSGGGTLIQITGGSSRRAIPGRGPWAAGAFATRALTQSAALELRELGIHAALLIVDATIRSPKTEPYMREAAEHDLANQEDVARAVEYLAGQHPTAWTHELQITPSGDRWVP